MQSKPATFQNNQIGLQEFWMILVKHKLIMISIPIITLIVTISYIEKVKPCYSGEVLIELGEIIINYEQTNNKPTIIQPLEKSTDLKEILMHMMYKDSLRIESPASSDKLIRITYEHTDKKKIHTKLEESIAYILTRHNEKAKFFENADAKISPAHVIGSISIVEQAIKPKKSLIVVIGFISGLMFGIFLAFFREFISNGRKVDETPEMNKE